MTTFVSIRNNIRDHHLADESQVLSGLLEQIKTADIDWAVVSQDAADLINEIRQQGELGLMEVFLVEYGLSTNEGVALMCLAEALLRIPDAHTVDEFIEDKIGTSSWNEHLNQSDSTLVNASTWALSITEKVLNDTGSQSLSATFHRAVRRLGVPVIRSAVRRAMKELGHQFVLGRDIQEAIRRGTKQEADGYTYSYDMLGEAALTQRDADDFYVSYREAIDQISVKSVHPEIRDNPGISIKLSALHPRYEVSQKQRVMEELVPRVLTLAIAAKEANMGLNIDAEEADRLELSLDVIEAVLSSPTLATWDGFGVVVQAYSKRAPAVIDWLYRLSTELDRKIMVRLVKGAYWDTEIKRSQVEGLTDFPVFTDKAATDVSYICCAIKLMEYDDRIYAQFATHNAHTVSAIIHIANSKCNYEFQCLHGMGTALYNLVLNHHQSRCRIYAPVGSHRDLLAYLVRRLLENGANSSFVNQIANPDVPATEIAADPINAAVQSLNSPEPNLVKPGDLFLPERKNSQGWDLNDRDHIDRFLNARQPFMQKQWTARSLIASAPVSNLTSNALVSVFSPCNPEQCIGQVAHATSGEVEHAIAVAQDWSGTTAQHRAGILNKAANLFEKNAGELFASLCVEAGKTGIDAIAELREAVDFLRFYAAEAVRTNALAPRGIFTCISPWNFPLAIFTGQVSAALAAGNGVLAKPADPTPIIASIAVRLLHEAGVPESALQLILGSGQAVGLPLTTSKRVQGICFTGSTEVAGTICRNAAAELEPDTTFIAETGGLNAMIVDSTALPEQAIQDIIDSAFRSCGQRCSALRVLYLQEDIAEEFLEMLYGAMGELTIADTAELSTDIGPVITEAARDSLAAIVEKAKRNGTLLKQLAAPEEGWFIGPAVIEVKGIMSLEKEIFGPVLHVATFKASSLKTVLHDINESGFGLTFGLHTRIEQRIEYITSKLKVGNMYVNRNQIGAVVGSQPFGGEGLSGTGPKAGGPHYVSRFKKAAAQVNEKYLAPTHHIDPNLVQEALNSIPASNFSAIDVTEMPGPTGETNCWSTYPRGTVLCLGPDKEDAEKQAIQAKKAGCAVLCVTPKISEELGIAGYLDRDALSVLTGFAAVALWSDEDDLRQARIALSQRPGAILPLITNANTPDVFLLERHICINTTAAGGNASLLAENKGTINHRV